MFLRMDTATVYRPSDGDSDGDGELAQLCPAGISGARDPGMHRTSCRR